MPTFQDLTGQRFGRLTVIERGPASPGATQWVCRCDCGVTRSYRAGNLKSGISASCGCRQRELAAKATVNDLTGKRFGRLVCIQRAGTYRKKATWLFQCDCGNQVTMPGTRVQAGVSTSCGCARSIGVDERRAEKKELRSSPEYKAWENAKQRCFNPKNPRFKDYGARGITMSPEWRDSFEAFLRDVGPRPSPELSIDRVDNNGNYEKGNVEWRTRSAQQTNRQPYKRVSKADVINARGDAQTEIERLTAVDANQTLLIAAQSDAITLRDEAIDIQARMIAELEAELAQFRNI